MFAGLQPGEHGAALVRLGVDGAREELQGEHPDERGGRRPVPGASGVPEEQRRGDHQNEREHPEPDAAASGGERPEEERHRGGAEPRDRRPPPERPFDEALDPGRGQDREREHDHVAETARVMEIHVAERDPEHERPEPPRSDEERRREDVGRERESADGHDERTEPASASREEGARERHRARVGPGRRGEPERPRRPDAVGAEWIADLCLAGFAERAVAAAQAGLTQEVHVGHEDRQRRDRQHDDEQRDVSRRAPRARSTPRGHPRRRPR